MTLHDEVEIEDMDWNEELMAFTYQCPCGDLFQITMEELTAGERSLGVLWRGRGIGGGRTD
jgi:diphthamide biosynthesis protein 3